MPAVVLGLDPGFASFGWCALSLTAAPSLLPVQLRAVAAGVLRTSKSAAKHHVYASDDNVARARDLWVRLSMLVAEFKPAALCAEAMSFPRNASAAAKVAISWGLLAALAEEHRLPLIQALPQAVKLACCGKKDASKDEVALAVANLTGMHDGLLGGVPKGQYEHPYDACAVAVACLGSDVLRLLAQPR